MNQIHKILVFWPLGVRTSLFSLNNWFASVFVLLKSMNIFKFNTDPSKAVEGEENGKVMVTLDVSIPSNPFTLLGHKLFQLWTKPKGYLQGFVDEKGNIIPVVLTPQALLHWLRISLKHRYQQFHLSAKQT